ncbi:MAG: PDZ domain-containing protein [Acidobacteriota bacterium]|nr:PDZ domain-containing protein [Acidobacteriota bacterium]
MTNARNNSMPLILAALIAMMPLSVARARGLQDTETDSEKVKVKQRLKVVVGDEEGAEPQVFFLGDDESPMVFDVDFGQRAYLGVGLLNITPELREHFGVAGDSGVLISEVAAGSPASTAGIRAGDVLTAIDGEPVARSGEIVRAIGRREDNETVSLEIWREGKMTNIGATLEVRERSQVDVGRMLRHGVPIPEIPHFEQGKIPMRVIEVETGKLDEALLHLRERLESPEWKARIEEMSSRRHGLEERILELEERLREMEKRLSEGGG